MLEKGYLGILKWNEKDIINSIKKEKAKQQNELTEYYIEKFTKMLEDIRKQIAEEEKKNQ